MKQFVTQAIVLSRIEYGEADRIITLLTPEQGKLRLMARGVRRAKSKLAGGIELFSVSNITYMSGRGDLGTLISARLETHYGNIVKDITRVQLGYELIKQMHKITEDNPEADYFELLQQAFAGLNGGLDPNAINLWFVAQLLDLAGTAPNLKTDVADAQLTAEQHYMFDFDAMAFAPHASGTYGGQEIKVLRLLFGVADVSSLQRVQGLADYLPQLTPLLQTMRQTYLHV